MAWPYNHVDGKWKIGLKEFLHVSKPYENYYENLRRTLKDFLPKSEDNVNQQVDLLVCLFVMATWFIK